jgi:hypothetical protein
LFREQEKFGIGIKIDGKEYYILDRQDKIVDKGTD